MSSKDEFGINQKKLEKRVEKIKEVYKDKWSSFYEIFDSLDKGDSILTDQMEDKEMKELLEKLFKTLKIKSITEEGSYKKPTNKKKLEKMNYGDYIRKKMKVSDEDETMDNFLQGIMTSDGNLNQFLNKRIKHTKTNPIQKNDQIEYLGAVQEKEKLTEEQLRAQMREWDEQNRGQSLLEMHQKKKQKKEEIYGKEERAMFNRDQDLQIVKYNSKQVLQQLKRGGGMHSKFSHGSIQNSFL